MTEDILILGAGAEAARAACVFVHGRGQTPEEIAADLSATLLAPGIRLVLPRAPGKSWYKARAADLMAEPTPAQLAASLDRLGAAVAAAGPAPVLLAGFSQGACLALEFALQRQAPRALAVLTGCRVGGTAPGPAPVRLAGTAAWITGSEADSWIPLWAFEAAAATLARQGARLRADLYPGRPHEIGPAERAGLAAMLRALARGGDPFGWPEG